MLSYQDPKHLKIIFSALYFFVQNSVCVIFYVSMQADMQPESSGCNEVKYNLNVDTIEAIFKTYPAGNFSVSRYMITIVITVIKTLNSVHRHHHHHH